MITLGTLGSIILGIAVISGLMKGGEMGCFGGCFLILLLVVLLLGGLVATFLFTVGGGIF